jgi:GT2 family glycosyltransferase
MKEAPVLILIVTFNKKDYVADLLKSLADIDYGTYDIVVVDNASSDGTAEYIEEQFPSVQIIKNPENTGGSGGFNTGLSYAFTQEKYKYYWLLDNDVVVSRDALSELVRVLEEHGDIAVAGSQMCQLDNPAVTNEIGAYVDFYGGRLVLNRHLTRRCNNEKGLYYVDYVAAASMLVRADVAKVAGLWEDFFIHFDDVDWCLRIKQGGHKIVGVAESVIWHLSAAEKPVTWQHYYDARNMLYVLKAHSCPHNVSRFARRKCLQAVVMELRGLTHVAEIILDAADDFLAGKKGKKIFNFPASVDVETLKKTHPADKVFVCQSEWFDLRKFPFEGGYADSIKDVMLPHYLSDARWFWRAENPQKVTAFNKLQRGVLVLAGLMGYRKYKRAYVDIHAMPFDASFLALELVVMSNDQKWIIPRDKHSVWKSLSMTIKRSMKLYVRFMFTHQLQ